MCFAHLCNRHGCTQIDTMECMLTDLCTKDVSKNDKYCRVKHICSDYEPICDDDQGTPSQPPCSSDNTPPEKDNTPQPPKIDGPTFEDIKNMSDEELLKSEGIEL